MPDLTAQHGRIAVYCEGPRDLSHERYIISEFDKMQVGFEGELNWINSRTWTDDEGRIRRAIPPKETRGRGRDGVMFVKTRFKCPRCGLDEQRQGFGLAISAILDKLNTAGMDEISVQNLLRLADR